MMGNRAAANAYSLLMVDAIIGRYPNHTHVDRNTPVAKSPAADVERCLHGKAAFVSASRGEEVRAIQKHLGVDRKSAA